MSNQDKYTQSERKIALLNEQIEVFKKAIQACEDIKNGAPETTVCAKYDINRNYFRKLVFDPNLGFHPDPIEYPLTEDHKNYRSYWKNQWVYYCWEERLFCAVFGEYDINKVPTHLEEAVPAVLDTLTDREHEVLLYRFKDNMTFRQISEIYNRSADRIRQIEAKALRKLRHPSRANILKFGVEYTEKMNQLRERNANRMEEAKENMRKLDKEVNDAIKSSDIQHLISLREIINGYLSNALDEKFLDSIDDTSLNNLYAKLLSIEDAGLSVRTYNCIVRGTNCKSLYDFADMSVDSILHIRNMGRSSLNELAEKLAEYNIYLKNEDGSYYRPNM